MGALASAQPGSIAGPTAGYVFDPVAKAVRQIRGIAGAATMSQPVDFGMAITGAEISSRGDFAAATAGDGTLHLFRLAGGTSTEVTADNLIAAPDRMLFSPTGTALLLYNAGKMQVLSGLPDRISVSQIQVVPDAQVASAARRTGVGALAVSDDGAYVLMGRGPAVWLMSLAGPQRILTAAGALASVAFAPNTHDAAVVSGGTLSVFRDVAGASTRQDYPNASTGGVAFSADASKVVMAGLRGVTVLNRATGEASQTACECRVGGLTAMGTLFRLNDPGAEPLWLVDPAGAEPRMVFVPVSN
jgi:hypothetical protein